MKPFSNTRDKKSIAALAKASLIALMASGFLSACSTKALDWAGGGSAISGSVLPLAPAAAALSAGLSRAVAASSVCSAATAALYKVDAGGKRIEPAALATPVAADGTYKFEGVKAKGIEIESRKLKAAYVVDIIGCGSVYSRILTGTKGQDIGFGTTLVSYALNTGDASAVLATGAAKLEGLYSDLSAFTSFPAAYAALVTNTPIRMSFEDMVGRGPEVLQDAAPNAVSITVPARLRENEVADIRFEAKQWDTNYSYAYEWSLDGQLLSRNNNPNFSPTGNMQGPHTLSVRWGKQNSSNELDTGKPFQTRSFAIVVENNTSPVPPVLSAITPNVNTPSVQLSIATGAGLANCDTFSSLAITEDLPVAPATPGSYIYSCSQSPSQTLTFLLQNGLGTRTLYLWAMDAAGNISASPRVITVNYSLIVPVVTIASPSVPNTPFQDAITVSGSCEDDSGDVSLSGPISGSPLLSSCVGGAFSRTITLTGADGTKTIQASQTNQFNTTGTASITVLKDTTAPLVEFSSAAPATFRTASINISAVFSESVVGFDLSKITVGNGIASGLTGSGATYSFTVTPASQGPVTVDIAPNAAADGAGNSSAAASSFSRVYDSVAPTVVSIASTAGNPTRLSSIPVSITFSEPVTGFSSAGLELTNATVASISGSGASYTFQLNPVGQGAVSVSVRTSAAQDAGGNGNNASSTLNRNYDSVGPVLSLDTTASEPTNISPIPVSASFTEAVADFALADILVTNGTASNLAGSGTSYTFDITPSGNGLVSVAVAAGAASDAAGNGSLAANLTRTFNNSRPIVNLTSTRPSPTNLTPFPITVTFSTSVNGFDASMISASNATVGAFSGSGATYTFTATPMADGPVLLSVAANSVADDASNQNLASNTLSITYDTQAPVVAVTSPAANAYINLANEAAFEMSGTCSEEGRTVTLSIGSVSGSSPCAGGIWSASLDLQSLANGLATLSVSQSDAAGNVSAAATRDFTKDSSTPTITLSGAPASRSNQMSLAVSAGGSGVVAYRYKLGAAGSTDCAVAAGYSAERAVATSISDSISGVIDGPVRVCAVGKNAAGNYQPFSSATPVSWTKDTIVSPFSGLSLAPASPGRINAPTISGNSEASASLQLYAQSACAGSVFGSATAGGGGAFSLTSSALSGDGAYAFSVRATDTAGNSVCSSSLNYQLDTVAPTVTISSSAPVNTNSSPIPVSLGFSEAVTGLTASGISVTNGTVGGLAGSGASYTFHITPTGQGSITAAVSANAATDSAGNASQASLTLTRSFDTVAPALSIVSPAEGAAFKTAAVTLSGSCEAGLPISLSGTGHASPSSTICPSGTFSVAITPSAGEGIKNITLTQTDAAGNETQRTRALVKDTIAPALLFTSTAVQNQFTRTDSVSFTGSCESNVQIQVGGTDSQLIPCTASSWTYSTTPRSTDGARSYTFTQTDAAGNSTLITGYWSRDKVAPIVTLSSPAANFAATESVTLVGTCEVGTGITFSGPGLLSTINNVPCSTGNYSQLAYFSPDDGLKAVTVSQTDLAGNTASVSRNFVRDTTPPLLTQNLQVSPYHTNTDTAQFGGTCEAGLAITVGGIESASTPCSAGGTWAYTTASRTSDANRLYTFTQVDAAGNQAQISATWVRDKVLPTLTLTSAASFTTSGNSVSFAGNCEVGINVAVSGGQSASVPCASGSWSFATSKDADGTYNYTFTQTDLAQNARSVGGTWTRSTTGPTLTITQTTPQVTNGSNLLISGTCSGGTAGSNGVITISGAVSSTTSCSGAGTWSYNASQGADGTYNYNFSLTDNFPTPRSTSASIVWQRDNTRPSIGAGTFTINGGQNPTSVSYNPIAFSAADNLTTVSKFCLKPSASAPAASDDCWFPLGGSGTGAIPANAVSIGAYPFNIGIIPKAYSIYLWVMDGAGNISVNAANLNTDLVNITLAPLPPPTVASVVVSKNDTMDGTVAERLIPAGSDVFIRWTVTGSSLKPAPISLSFSADDVTWTSFATNLSNGQNNCSSVTGSGPASASATGCYHWASRSPTNSYYRIRVSATNDSDATTFANSPSINTSNFRMLAGNTETGLNGAAKAAVFQANYANASWVDAQSLVVNSRGVIYFRDINSGIVSVDPKDGIVKRVIGLGATTSGLGDNGPASAAKLRFPNSIAIDNLDRLLIYDFNRIRRIDFSSSPPVIRTIIGGGSNTDDSVATATSLAFSGSTNSYSSGNRRVPLIVAPNNDIYFFSDDSRQLLASQRLRKYSAATGAISSIYLSGSSPIWSNMTGKDIVDASKCGFGNFFLHFDPATGSVLNFYATVMSSSSLTECSSTTPTNVTWSGIMKFSFPSGVLDSAQVPATYISTGTLASATSIVSPVPAMDGKVYLQDKGASNIRRYDPNTNSYAVLVGTNQRGACADGTNATSCAVDVGGAFVDTRGQLYFVDRGMIRTVVDGNVVTLYGQSVDFGDNGSALDARFGAISGVGQRSDSKLVLMDTVALKLRMMARDSSDIVSIAGNGSFGGSSSTTAPTVTLSMNVVPNVVQTFFIDSNDNVYTQQTNHGLRKLAASYATNPANTLWSVVTDGLGLAIYGGSRAFYSPEANGRQASEISLTGVNDTRFVGGYGDRLMMFHTTAPSGVYGNLTYAEINLNTGVYNINLGPAARNYSNVSACADGIPVTSCNQLQFSEQMYLGYDPLTSKWLLPDYDRRTIRSFGTGGTGNLDIVTIFNAAVNSFVFKRFPSHSPHAYYYYCHRTNGRMYLRNASTATEVALNWPVPTVSCTGSQFVYDDATDSLIFPVRQNGLDGVGELFNVHPSVYGL